MAEVPAHALSAGDHRLDLAAGPLLMGILNASPESFYDGGEQRDPDTLAERGRALVSAGASIVDVGGESGVTIGSALAPEEEIERVVPVIERLAAEGALVSVDTYKGEVARAAIEAGATIVNDPSGLSDAAVAHACAETGAALVITHTRARPKQKLERPRYADVVEDVKRFLCARLERARALGVPDERILLCPGPDLGKDPAQTVELLRRLGELHDLGRPILLAVSRKDFVGALTGRAPSGRLAGTLAAVAHGVSAGAQVLRLHDVAEARDFLAVRAALAGEQAVAPSLRLGDHLRREPAAETAARRRGREAVR